MDPNIPREPDPNAIAPDVSEDMRQLCDELAVADLTMRPANIWDQVKKAMDAKHNGIWIGLKKHSIVDRVRVTRKGMNHGDAFRTIENTSSE